MLIGIRQLNHILAMNFRVEGKAKHICVFEASCNSIFAQKFLTWSLRSPDTSNMSNAGSLNLFSLFFEISTMKGVFRLVLHLSRRKSYLPLIAEVNTAAFGNLQILVYILPCIFYHPIFSWAFLYFDSSSALSSLILSSSLS